MYEKIERTVVCLMVLVDILETLLWGFVCLVLLVYSCTSAFGAEPQAAPTMDLEARVRQMEKVVILQNESIANMHSDLGAMVKATGLFIDKATNLAEQSARDNLRIGKLEVRARTEDVKEAYSAFLASSTQTKALRAALPTPRPRLEAMGLWLAGVLPASWSR